MKDQRVIDTDAIQIEQMLRDMGRLRRMLSAFSPEEIVQLKRRLEEASRGEAGRSYHELFFKVSSVLYETSSLSMGELSAAISVPLSTATRMVDWLVDNGYAERLPDPSDRRVVRVALTGQGRQVHTTIKNYMAEQLSAVLFRLSPEERGTFLALLHKMVSGPKEAHR